MKEPRPSGNSSPRFNKDDPDDWMRVLDEATPEDWAKAVEERKKELERLAPKTPQVFPVND